jgi:carboxymethylenebutenolidase
MRAVSRGEGVAVEQVVAARDWLAATVKIPATKIGVIGFCMGAGLAFAVGRSFAAVSGNYGLAPPESVLAGSAPVIGCFGMRDRMFRGQADILDERLSRLGVRHEVHKFEDAGHSFLTDGKHPIAKLFSQPFLSLGGEPGAAEDGWKKILRFFDAELGFR